MGPAQHNLPHHLGQDGETYVAHALQRAGYTILARNWRHELGELDIVARTPDGSRDEVVFVEVKTRRGPAQKAVAAALTSVGEQKRERLVALAEAYLSAAGLEGCRWRIDVAALAWNGRSYTMEVITNAVEW